MSYAERYEEHKAYWDRERQRRKIDRYLKGKRSPTEKEVIRKLKKDKQENG